jgi:hypothetical protein
MDEESEWQADFGAPGVNEAELEELLRKARSTDDATLRRLVKQFRTLQRTASQVLHLIEEDHDVLSVRNAEVTRFLRFLVGASPLQEETKKRPG